MFLLPSTQSMKPDKLFRILVNGFRQNEENANSDIKQDLKTKFVFCLLIDLALLITPGFQNANCVLITPGLQYQLEQHCPKSSQKYLSEFLKTRT